MVACLMELLFNVVPQVLSIILFYFRMSTARYGPINSTFVAIGGFLTGKDLVMREKVLTGIWDQSVLKMKVYSILVLWRRGVMFNLSNSGKIQSGYKILRRRHRNSDW
jgi:hypothetical protein